MTRLNMSPRAFLAALCTVSLFAAIAAGMVYGIELSVLCLGAGALGLSLWSLWASVRSLSSDTPLTLDEAMALLAPSAAEEQKRSVLRALKDLEFERSVGKITEQDYREFSERYRAEARRLIENLDAAQAETRKLAEKLVADAVAKNAGTPSADSKERSTDLEEEPGDPKKKSADPADAEHGAARDASADDTSVDTDADASELKDSAAVTCESCQTRNDVDARFCKHCGAPLGKPSVKLVSEKEAS
ncbi:MAG TPA: zinc ribbon domain-containing protein [Polyangiaceae bacterium]|nr:zinc ribbon domain-containing protein [Polyangiaceae bacterium]